VRRRHTQGVPMTWFRNRRHAGQLLAVHLSHYAGRGDVLVRDHAELAMGAIAGGGVRVLNRDIVRGLRLDGVDVDRVSAAEKQELERRERAYRDDRPAPEIWGKTVILVDDGLATGSTMFAAVTAVQMPRCARCSPRRGGTVRATSACRRRRSRQGGLSDCFHHLATGRRA
jgi:predicted phosphoribosyltransferase